MLILLIQTSTYLLFGGYFFILILFTTLVLSSVRSASFNSMKRLRLSQCSHLNRRTGTESKCSRHAIFYRKHYNFNVWLNVFIRNRDWSILFLHFLSLYLGRSFLSCKFSTLLSVKVSTLHFVLKSLHNPLLWVALHAHYIKYIINSNTGKLKSSPIGNIIDSNDTWAFCCLLYLKIDFNIPWYVFSVKGLASSNSGIFMFLSNWVGEKSI